MAKNVWIGNSRWPSGRNLGEFAKDVFRLENCKTDKEKALAFYEWLIRVMMRGPNFTVPDGFGTYSRSFDTMGMFASFGCFECTGWGWVGAEALQAAGLKARRVVGQDDGHTIYEVFYDNAWHAFDAFQAWYYLNESKEVASCADVTANPALVHNPVGTSSPLGYHTDLSFLGKRHAWSDALDIVQKVQNEMYGWDLKKGMEIANLYEPADPQLVLYCGNEYPRGSHCQIAAYNHAGKPNFPQHEPFWKNYRKNMHDNSWFNSDKPVRTHGAGALRWQPLLYGAKAAAWSENAHFENGTVRPSGNNKHCEVWYEIKVPYYISYIFLEGYVKGGGSDYVGFALSADGGKTVTPISGNITKSFRLRNGMEEKKNGKTSVQYTKSFLIRLDMHSHSSDKSPLLESLRITVGYQQNMFTQPMILPGKNSLWLEGASLEGDKLTAEWNYTVKGKDGTTALLLSKDGKEEKAVDLGFEEQGDIVMRGVSIRC
ncbi:MAG: hypothetical protein JNL74_07245, partial [Fibrobacteres bacterium]|nr:hypothetical protein [Fibrobacterota bacterium]